MTPLSIAVLSLSMSADAFAAAVGRGAAERPSVFGAIRAGLVFGLIETLTPVIGWSLGLATAGFVTAIDHWVAFGLLAVVGGRMAFEGLKRRREREPDDTARPRSSPFALVATAVGTSIDAAAVGVTLAFLNVSILTVALSIGLATFTMATLGMVIGRAAGSKLGSMVEVVGGIALIGLGAKILLEHLGSVG